MIIYNFIKYLILYIRYNTILGRVIKDDNLLDKMSVIMNTPVKRDWLGRIYMVINPYVKDGKFDPNTQIFELGQDQPSEYVVEKFVMERLNVIKGFVRANNLFDILSYEIKQIDDYYNYLFIMQVIPLQSLKIWSKRFIWLVLCLLVLGVSGYFMYPFIFSLFF